MDRRANLRAAAALMLGGVIVGIYFALSHEAQLVAYVAIALGSAVTIALAARGQGALRLAWLLVAAGVGLFGAGDAVFNLTELVGGAPTGFPSVADPVYLAGYPALVAGSLLFGRHAGGPIGRTGLVDVTMVTVGAVLLEWAFVLSDAAAGEGWAGRATIVAYAAADALLVFASARAVALRGALSTAGVTLLAAIGLLLAADIMYDGDPSGYTFGGLTDALFLLSYMLLAVAALMAPGRRYAVRPLPAAAVQVARVVLLGMALLAPVIVLAVSGIDGRVEDVWLIVAFSACTTVLVLFRFALTLQTIVRSHEHEVEERLIAEQSGARLSSLIANLQAGVLVEDASRRIVLVNEEFCRLFAIPAPPSALVGMDCSDAAEQSKHLMADPDGFVARVADVLAGRQLVLSDEVVFADGRLLERDYVPVEVDGIYEGHLWHYRDVTARRALEAGLRSSQAYAAATIATALDAVIAIDQAGQILEFNPAAEAIFGFRRDDVLGRHMSDLIIPERLRAAHEARLAATVAGAAPTVLGRRIEIDALHASGHEFPIELAITTVPGASPPIFTAYLRDISARRKAAAELAEARDVALEATRLKSEFLAVMSHEIRTPMYGVIGTIDLLQDTALDADQRELLGVLQDSSHGLLGILNEVLDFSKIEAGKVELEAVEFDLGAVVEAVVEQFSAIARKKGLRLATEIAADVPEVLVGDPGRIRQVLHNLVGNAVKFTDEGDVVVRATAEPLSHSWTTIRLEVGDTGIGIADEVQAGIFEPFTQLDSAHSRAQAGTGLGLTICERLVRLMDGGISCESTEGLGTTISVTFRLRSAQGESERAIPPLAGINAAVCGRAGIALDAVAGTLDGLGARVEAVGAGAGHLPGGTDVLVVVGDDVDAPADPNLPRVLLGTGGATTVPGATEEHAALPVRRQRLGGLVLAALGRTAPFDLDDVPHASVRHANVETAGEPALALRTDATILLVEDNDVNRLLALRQLARLGLPARGVSSGAQAIEAFGHGRYALILMDCRMPVMDGFEATRAIRALEAASGSHIPIVAMTADARPEDRAACLAAGMDDFLSKPLTLADLGEALGRWLGASQGPITGAPVAPGRVSAEAGASYSGLQSLVEDIGVTEVARLVETWRAELPGRRAELRRAADAGDARGLAESAHVLKSICALFGIDDATELATGLEATAREGVLAGTKESALALDAALARALVALERWLAGL